MRVAGEGVQACKLIARHAHVPQGLRHAFAPGLVGGHKGDGGRVAAPVDTGADPRGETDKLIGRPVPGHVEQLAAGLWQGVSPIGYLYAEGALAAKAFASLTGVVVRKRPEPGGVGVGLGVDPGVVDAAGRT